MPHRQQLTWAVLASLGVHAAMALALWHLPGGAVASTSLAAPTFVIRVEAMANAMPHDKLTVSEALVSAAATWSGGHQTFSVPNAGAMPTGSGWSLPKDNTQAPSASLAGTGATAPGNRPPTSGPKPTTTFFGIPATGSKIVYVVDCSGSMGLHNGLLKARLQLDASLRQLPATALFQVVVYNQHARVLLGPVDELVPATAENVARAISAMAALEPMGGTQHLPALKLALRLQPHDVYFLTDADDLSNADRATATQLAGGAMLHTIALTLAPGESPAGAPLPK